MFNNKQWHIQVEGYRFTQAMLLVRRQFLPCHQTLLYSDTTHTKISTSDLRLAVLLLTVKQLCLV